MKLMESNLNNKFHQLLIKNNNYNEEIYTDTQKHLVD
jgi:hypothetical protein